MPFKSEAQRRYLYSQKPEVAKKFSEHSGKQDDLPERMHKKLSKRMKEHMKKDM